MVADNRRNEYRIVYPIADRPRMEIGCEVYEVLDLSEGGLRLLAPDLQLGEAQRIQGMLYFSDGGRAYINGSVFRRTDKHLVIELDRNKIPYQRIVQEQRFLISRYGHN